VQRRPLPPPYATIAFDCDSTLSAIEGIDELAGERREEIVALTRRAMEGELALEEVYGARLALLLPSLVELERVGRLYVERCLPHARELCAALRALGKRVCIVSGGLRRALDELARVLGVVDEDLFAVDTRHDAAGAYLDFDRASPLARSGGKLEVLAALARAGAPVALVGDGATDLEARPAVARFVAFGGVARRAAVFAAADETCDRPDLAALLPLLCDELEVGRLVRDEEHVPLVEAALTHYR